MSLQSVVACRSVKDFSDPVLDLIERTYTESFPEVERRDFSLVRNLVRDESRFIVYALSKESRYVGFITGWLFDGYTYVEHFAIDPAARNGGIGAEAMKQFLVFCGTPVVLEVEMPTDEMSKRRIGFYERLGFEYRKRSIAAASSFSSTVCSTVVSEGTQASNSDSARTTCPCPRFSAVYRL